MDTSSVTIAVVGLGYVGLPLAVEFGKQRGVIGFDVDPERISELSEGTDRTREVSEDDLKLAEFLTFTSSPEALRDCGIVIVAVPTPIDPANRPDLRILRSASDLIGENLSPGTIVIYESTVFPGCTRQVCVPRLEEKSGLTFNEDFFVVPAWAGYAEAAVFILVCIYLIALLPLIPGILSILESAVDRTFVIFERVSPSYSGGSLCHQEQR